MNNFRRILYVLFFVAIVCCSCFRIDTESNDAPLKLQKKSTNNENIISYGEIQTRTINGIDYAVSRAPVGEYGGQIVSSTIGEGPKTFNPWVSKDATSSQVADLMFESLLSTDPYTGDVIPRLAKSFSVSDDKKEFIVTLRKGIKWSDGVEITADDIVFTWNNIILAGFGNTSLRDSVLIDGQFPIVEKLDKYSVKFSIPKPFAPFMRFMGTQIAPKHVFKDVVSKGKRYFDSYLSTTINPSRIVCSGPFILEEYVPAQRVVFRRNPNYYFIDEKNNLLPYLDKYIILIVGDLNNELLKFEAGELDLISIRGKDVARFKEKEKNSDFKIYNLGPNSGTTFIAFNLNTRKDANGKFYVNPIKQKWFNDINFRTAIDYAIDRKAMISNILNGVAQPLYTAEALTSLYLNQKLALGHVRDLQYAKELLQQSGFYYDEQGNLRDIAGNLVEFDLYTNAGQTEREASGVMIKQDLKELGMKVNFKPIEFNSLVSKTISTYDWDMILMALTGSSLEPHGGKNVWYSRGHLHLFNKRSETDTVDDLFPWEKELDEVIEKGALELEFDARKVYYDRYQQIIYDERPMIYLYSTLSFVAIRNKIKNLYPTPLGGAIHNVHELYIDNNDL